MAPCSYVNDAAMDDISSLFQIKVSDLGFCFLVFTVDLAYQIHFVLF